MAATNGKAPVLFLLDELLSGTNSHDRRIGASAVVRGLTDAGAAGLITTHDLALTAIAEELPGGVDPRDAFAFAADGNPFPQERRDEVVASTDIGRLCSGFLRVTVVRSGSDERLADRTDCRTDAGMHAAETGRTRSMPRRRLLSLRPIPTPMREPASGRFNVTTTVYLSVAFTLFTFVKRTALVDFG